MPPDPSPQDTVPWRAPSLELGFQLRADRYCCRAMQDVDWETQSVASDASAMSTMTSTNYDERDVAGKLFSLCRHNRSKEVEAMLDSGTVTVELRGEFGMTPLMAACMVISQPLLHDAALACDPADEVGCSRRPAISGR